MSMPNNNQSEDVELRATLREMFKEYLAKHEEGYNIDFVPDVFYDKIRTTHGASEYARGKSEVIKDLDRRLDIQTKVLKSDYEGGYTHALQDIKEALSQENTLKE